MKHRSSARIQYGRGARHRRVGNVDGDGAAHAASTGTSTTRIRSGSSSAAWKRCSLRKARRFFEPGTVPMFNPGEVHDGGPATEDGWSYRMVYLDPVLVPGERVFPFAERRDREARSAVARTLRRDRLRIRAGHRGSARIARWTCSSRRPASVFPRRGVVAACASKSTPSCCEAAAAARPCAHAQASRRPGCCAPSKPHTA